MSSKHTNWTDEMDAYLVAHYHSKSASQIATELQTSKQAVLRRARKLDVKRKTESDSAERPTYSAEEDAYIKGFIEQQGIEAVAEQLNRSVNAIRKRAQRLGVSTASHVKALTEEEQKYLERNLGVKSYSEIGQVLNRKQTQFVGMLESFDVKVFQSGSRQARYLRLHRDVIQGKSAALALIMSYRQ